MGVLWAFVDAAASIFDLGGFSAVGGPPSRDNSRPRENTAFLDLHKDVEIYSRDRCIGAATAKECWKKCGGGSNKVEEPDNKSGIEGAYTFWNFQDAITTLFHNYTYMLAKL